MLGFFPIQKNTIQKNTIQKIAIQKNYYVLYAYKKLPYKKFTMQCTHKKIAIHFLLCIFFHTKNYYVLHAKKITYKKNVSVFPIQKITMQCTHKKITYKKITIQKIYYVFSHTKNYHTKKMLVFFLHTQKNIM